MSDIEYEGKILDIDVDAVVETIKSAGGKQGGDYKLRRYTFDTIPAKAGLWARLRTDGAHSTLAVKEVKKDSIDGTSEWEVEVSDFDKTLTILKKCGLEPKNYQENRRIEFSLDGAYLSIDFWPQLKPYLEIEAGSKEEVEKIATILGFDTAQLVGDNTTKLYQRIGVDLDSIVDLRFE